MDRSYSKPQLSPLMKELLAGVANGKQLKEMAQDRFVSYSTATNTVHEAKKRLGAKSLAHAVVQAMGWGIISHPTGPDYAVYPY